MDENNFYEMNEPMNTPEPSEEPKKKSAKPAVIAVAAVLLCALTFVGGALFGRGTNETGSVPLPTETASKKTESTSDIESKYEFETESSGKSFSVKEIAAMTMDTVVEITTETVTRGSYLGQYISTGAGSGVIIREDGMIVTNHHVIEDATQIVVRLRSGEEYSATVIGSDSESDIAVLKIDATGLPTATIGDSSKLVVGEEVIAIGNPLGSLGGTVTNGIISALERSINMEGQLMTLLQTNAAVNPGNSGGGLFNEAGELIGIVNGGASGDDIEGIGFAIPINTAKPVMEDIINYGYVRGKVKLGVTLLDISTENYARYYGVPDLGVYVSEVTENGDADKAGLKSGDRIKSINGREISSQTDVAALLKTVSVGDTLTFDIVRYTYSSGWRNTYESEELTLTLTLTEYREGTTLIS